MPEIFYKGWRKKLGAIWQLGDTFSYIYLQYWPFILTSPSGVWGSGAESQPKQNLVQLKCWLIN